jgi:hypothetical protein
MFSREMTIRFSVSYLQLMQPVFTLGLLLRPLFAVSPAEEISALSSSVGAAVVIAEEVLVFFRLRLELSSEVLSYGGGGAPSSFSLESGTMLKGKSPNSSIQEESCFRRI